MKNNTNLILSIILSIAIIAGWQHFYERPRLNKLVQQQEYTKQLSESIAKSEEQTKLYPTLEALQSSPRIQFKNANISGSINLRGARIDDLVLLKYNEEIKNDQHVRLLSPSNTIDAYFAEVGWYGSNLNDILPNSQTLWQSDDKILTAENPIQLKWKSAQGVEFYITISLDDDCMFNIEQKILNNTAKSFDFKTYSLLNRSYKADKQDTILHKGPIAVIDGTLKEYSYSKLKDDSKETINNTKPNWLGITDKYWLTAFIPAGQGQSNINLKYINQNTSQNILDKFQVDLLSDVVSINPGQEYVVSQKLFAGAKQVKLLDAYANKYDIKLFDRAIDFGWLYVITKPLFYLMSFFYGLCGNFGLSIMLITILLKALTFGLSSKSGKSMKRIKELQPQMEKIKEKYGQDKMRMNQELLNLYKREGVNPMAGLLPILIQIPIFFAIYKVLYVTIEMRHAPFYGWIGDLSAADPTNVINLFGLLPFVPPSFLHVGIWPMLMSASMFAQQQTSGNVSADPVQAQVMKLLPLIFLFTFSGFPAGLLIYWTWSNVLSILQQTYINKFAK